MKKILVGILTLGFLCGNAEAATLADLMVSKEAITAVKKIDVGGTWGYILTNASGQRQYVEYETLQKQVKAIDARIETLKVERQAKVDLMNKLRDTE